MLPDSTALDKDLQTCLIRVRVREIADTNPADWHKLINAGYDFSQEAPHVQRFARTLQRWRAREKS